MALRTDTSSVARPPSVQKAASGELGIGATLRLALFITSTYTEPTLEIMNEKKDKVKFAWFARTYNNSRSPVTIASMVVDIGKSDSSGNLDWTAYNVLTSNKYDAYHSLSDQAVFVKGDESTSVGFDEAIDVTHQEEELIKEWTAFGGENVQHHSNSQP